MRPSATKCDQVRPSATTWGKRASGLTAAWQHSCGRIAVLCGCTLAHPPVTTKHSCSCFGLAHTRAHLGMFGLFQARLWYGHSSPIMDLRLKHTCSCTCTYYCRYDIVLNHILVSKNNKYNWTFTIWIWTTFCKVTYINLAVFWGWVALTGQFNHVTWEIDA